MNSFEVIVPTTPLIQWHDERRRRRQLETTVMTI